MFGILYFLLVPTRNFCSCCSKLITKMRNYLFFNGNIRFYMEVFLDVGLVASLNMHTVEGDSSFPSVQASNFMSIALIILICIWPLFFIFYACLKPKVWQEEKFQNKCGTVLENTDIKKQTRGERALLFASVMFFMRRVAFIISALIFRKTLWPQLAIQNFISLSMCIYLQWYRPFATNFMNNMETFNEITILVLTYFLFCFTDFVPEPETRY